MSKNGAPIFCSSVRVRSLSHQPVPTNNPAPTRRSHSHKVRLPQCIAAHILLHDGRGLCNIPSRSSAATVSAHSRACAPSGVLPADCCWYVAVRTKCPLPREHPQLVGATWTWLHLAQSGVETTHGRARRPPALRTACKRRGGPCDPG